MKSFLKNALFAAALITTVSGVAAAQELTPLASMPAGVYALDDTHASLTWKVSHMGMSNYTARFTKMTGELTFDPANPANSSLKATVDPASVRTDYPKPQEKDFDKKLAMDADWFNAGQFPIITFNSTKIEITGEKTAKVTGDLTFLGVTKPVTLDAVFNGAYAKMPMREIPAMGFSATGKIKRSDFGFSTYVPMIGDEVDLMIEVELHKKDA